MMRAESTGSDLVAAARRNAIETLEQAAADALAAGLTRTEANQIVNAAHGMVAGNRHTAAASVSRAGQILDSGLVDHLLDDGYGWLTFSLPYLDDPRWHANAPDPASDVLAVRVVGDTTGGADPYLFNELAAVDDALEAHRRRGPLNHGVDAPPQSPRDGMPLRELEALFSDRIRARNRAQAAAEPRITVTQHADGKGATVVPLPGLDRVRADRQGRLVGRIFYDEIPAADRLPANNQGWVRVYLDPGEYASVA